MTKMPLLRQPIRSTCLMGISLAIKVGCEMETRRSEKVRPGAGLLPTRDRGKADAVHHRGEVCWLLNQIDCKANKGSPDRVICRDLTVLSESNKRRSLAGSPENRTPVDS